MDFNAVYHRANDNYCYPLNENELVINLKTGYDVESVQIIQGDPFAVGILGGSKHWGGTAIEVISKKRLKNQLLWTITIKPPFKRLKYYFELRTKDEHWFFFEEGFLSEEQMKLEGRSRQYFIFPWMNSVDIAVTPKWVNETVWYQIFPERFSNGDPSLDRPDTKPWLAGHPVSNQEFYGGDLPGITRKLDYLSDLGINGIYLTPINEASTCHKYDTIDYLKIDPHFGSNESFAELVKEAHSHNIRVMVDGVFNHSGPLFAPWLDVVKKGPESAYFDWFMVNHWPIDFSEKCASGSGQYFSFAFCDYMPKLNTNNPDVIEYFVSVCEQWIKDYDIDGIRLDVANEVSHLFCKILRQRLKAIKPDIYILGEIWHDSMPWLRGDEFDAVMNYPLAESLKDFWIDKNLTNDDFEYMVNRCYHMYMQQVNDVLFNMLDSHDTKRLRSGAENIDVFYQQLLILFTMPGSPCIYYGTEIAMEGGHDPDCRRIMPWDEIEKGIYDERIEVIRSLIRLRLCEPLMRSRDFHFPKAAKQSRLVEYRKIGKADYYIEVFANCGQIDVEVLKRGEILFERKFKNNILSPYGVLVQRVTKK